MDQGKVSLRLRWDGARQRIAAAAIDSHRPQAAGVLVGRAPAEAVTLAPRLFSLCGCAQGVAARLAAAAATGGPARATTEERLAVAREAVGEHLWRLLLDWPMLLGQAPERETFLRWRKRLLAAESPGDSARLGRDLLDWLPSLPCPAWDEPPVAATAPLLPWQDAPAWAEADVDAGFAANPVLGGLPAETGALARQQAVAPVAALLADGRRTAARLAARRADLAFLAHALSDPSALAGWLDAAPAGNGAGLARVETARGLLLHLMQVKDGRVGRYVIVAPTEWNFHPRGAFAGELAGLPAASRDEAAFLARRLALALDPCVNYEVVIEDA